MANISGFTCGSCGREIESDLRVPCQCGGQAVVRLELEQIGPSMPALNPRQDGIWRYAPLLPFSTGLKVSHGEGGTPMRSFTVPAIGYGGRIDVKVEGRNPTGSCEDRGMACAFAATTEQRLDGIRLNSVGYSAVSAHAYSVLTGAGAQVAVNHNAPRSILAEIRMFGGEVHIASDMAPDERLFAVKSGQANPVGLDSYRIEGLKTVGFEIAEHFGWRFPDVVVCPFGTGLLTFSVWKSFTELGEVGWVADACPRLVSVRAHDPRRTIARSLSASAVGHSAFVERAVRESRGTFVEIENEEIVEAAFEFARSAGVLVSAEGAAGLACLRKLLQRGFLQGNERVVVIDPIDGLRYAEAFGRYLPRTSRGQEDKLGGLITPR